MNDETRDQILDHLQHRRFGQAQYHLRRLVRENEQDAGTRSLLALCLAELEQFDEAVVQATRAVELEPDEPYCQWTMAVVLTSRRQFKAALPHAQRLVELAPEDPDYWALLAQCHGTMGSWRESLAAAERGLAVDPDHAGCVNLRGIALQHTGRHADSEQAFVDASALDPENAFARAGRGWAALHAGGSAAAAIPHFHHALELDPQSEWARAGLIAALKARNPVYRVMLRYFLWMQSLSPRTRTIVIVAGILIFGRLRRLAEAEPSLAPVIYPVLALYVLFILLSWTADPLFDFLLRFDPHGRTLVDDDRRRAANAVVASIGIAIVAAILGLITGSEQLLILGLVCGFLVIPLAGTFQCERGWPRTTMATYTTVVALLGLAGVFLPESVGVTFVLASIFGAVLGSWLARWLSTKVPAR